MNSSPGGGEELPELEYLRELVKKNLKDGGFGRVRFLKMRFWRGCNFGNDKINGMTMEISS